MICRLNYFSIHDPRCHSNYFLNWVCDPNYFFTMIRNSLLGSFLIINHLLHSCVIFTVKLQSEINNGDKTRKECAKSICDPFTFLIGDPNYFSLVICDSYYGFFFTISPIPTYGETFELCGL